MSRPLSFLHLTTFYPPFSFGGDAMYVYRLCHALADEGHSVDVVHDIDSYHLLHPADPELNFASHPNVTVHGLRSGHRLLSPLLTQQTGYPFLKMRRVRELLDRKPYDVIHFHNISLLGPRILTVGPARDLAVKIYTTHEHWLVCPTHVLWKFGGHPCDKPDCLLCTLMARRPPQLWRYTRMLADCSKYVDIFVSPSRFTARMHAQRGFSRPVGHLPYFIDRTDEDWQRPGSRPQEQPYFLFVGRLEAIKGLQTLIDLWQKVPDYDLLVAGTGTHESQLRARAASNPRIRFLGPLSQRELGSLYFHAQACIVPSVTYETFGIIIVEAFARKTPAIVRDLGALPEVVLDSGGGLVYRDDEELLDCIDCLSSPVARSEYGERGYSVFLDRWSREAHMNQYFNTLREVSIQKHGFVPWEHA